MKSIYNVEEVTALISEGKNLLLAGDESVMEKLPKGNWIGGTIPYFMGDEGGVIAKDIIHVKELNETNKIEHVKVYAADELATIAKDYPSNGVSFIILPVFSDVHAVFAKDIISYEGIFNSPLVGWVAGVHLDEFGTGKVPKVYDGLTGDVHENKAVVMHTTLPADTYAKVEIVNIFDDDAKADVITFPQTGNVIGECCVNGEKTTLAEYLVAKKHDVKQPIIGDFTGAKLNVAIQEVNEDKKEVALYAPVFEKIEYRLSTPVGDYSAAFTKKLDAIKNVEMPFACNCVLNYLYGELEGKKTGIITGPMTFGEIAYMLLNQTMVYCTYHKK
jgi:hypothetical protein